MAVRLGFFKVIYSGGGGQYDPQTFILEQS